MPDSIMYQEEAYVLLEPNQPEQLLTPIELLDRLKAVLAVRQDDLPSDLRRFSDLEVQARHLMETSCELDVEPGQFLQWYVVRLEK
jgi:Protein CHLORORESPIRATORY REDUCTION 7